MHKLGRVLSVIVLSTACASTLARMEPLPLQGQDVTYRNDTPIVLSRKTNSDVVVEPSAGPTGRYQIDKRLYLLVEVRNHSGHRFEISENNFKVLGNHAPARVIRAVEIEDEIN